VAEKRVVGREAPAADDVTGSPGVAVVVVVVVVVGATAGSAAERADVGRTTLSSEG
jgi:hypothetical protein